MTDQTPTTTFEPDTYEPGFFDGCWNACFPAVIAGIMAIFVTLMVVRKRLSTHNRRM